MKHILLGLAVLASTLFLAAAHSSAEDAVQPAPAAAPAPSDQKTMETTGGCMPGGACCGQGACAQAGEAAAKDAPGAAAGGCPCKMKKAQQKKADG